ncbi:hypothetical protein IRJ41_021810 [Triplophysa rosa]|uniref:Uncharacterized protein n=1 Tax=Triplophysa rosa TaxID=992332 RepID=A0A9W7WD20_TRIRA|nr:hypothetical protein IRJ41_021810 [Triplophysa rosa]
MDSSLETPVWPAPPSCCASSLYAAVGLDPKNPPTLQERMRFGLATTYITRVLSVSSFFSLKLSFSREDHAVTKWVTINASSLTVRHGCLRELVLLLKRCVEK